MLLAAVLTAAPPGCPLPTKATGSSIFGAIARPLADVLAAFYGVVPNFAVAIVALGVVWMVIIAPLTLKSTRSMLAMQRLQPQLKKLQAEHKNDRQAFAQAQMDLFKQHNVSPFGSCLPMLLPLPVFFALFDVIDGLSRKTTLHIGGHLLKCPSPKFLSPHTAMFHAIFNADGQMHSLGLNLSSTALSGHSSLGSALPYFALLLLMIGTQYLQTVRMMSRNPAAADNPQARIMKYLPLAFGVIFINFPAGLILYYLTSNLCRIAQQELMYLFDPKVKTLATKELKEVTTEIDEIQHGERPRTASEAPAAKSRFRDLLNDFRDQAQQQRDTTSGNSTATKGKPTPRRSEAPARGGAGAKGGAKAPAGRSAPGGQRNRPAPAASPRSARSGGKPEGRTDRGGGGNGSAANGRRVQPDRPAANGGQPSNGRQPSSGGSRTGSASSGGNGASSGGNGSNGGRNGNGGGTNGSNGGRNGNGGGTNGSAGKPPTPRTGASRTGATGARPSGGAKRRRGR